MTENTIAAATCLSSKKFSGIIRSFALYLYRQDIRRVQTAPPRGAISRDSSGASHRQRYIPSGSVSSEIDPPPISRSANRPTNLAGAGAGTEAPAAGAGARVLLKLPAR